MIQFETTMGLVEIRELATIEDMQAAEQIQLSVWGRDTYPHPKEVLIPVEHEGGLLAGAFGPDGAMVGLVFQFPTRDPAIGHSQILAVKDAWRGQGIGRRLKWFQRSWCLEHGITCLHWTVDPLRAANAELNIRRLGGISVTYYLEYYGPMQGIDAGAPTDRLMVEWRLSSQRVEALADHTPPDEGFPGVQEGLSVVNGRPVLRDVHFRGEPLLVRLPDDFICLAQVDPGLALDWRIKTRNLFLQAFELGYVVSGFTRVGGPAYVLKNKEEGWI